MIMRMGEMEFFPEAGYEVTEQKGSIIIIITDIVEAKEDHWPFFPLINRLAFTFQDLTWILYPLYIFDNQSYN